MTGFRIGGIDPEWRVWGETRRSYQTTVLRRDTTNLERACVYAENMIACPGTVRLASAPLKPDAETYEMTLPPDWSLETHL